MDQVIKTLAYGDIPPLLAPGQGWNAESINALWAALAESPAVIVKVSKTPGGARRAAQHLRDQLGRPKEFEVQVVDKTKVVLCRKLTLDDLPGPPPPWHELYSPALWMDLDEAQEVFGYTRAYIGTLAGRYGIESKVWNGAGAKLFKRDQMMMLGERGRKTLKRRAETARLAKEARRRGRQVAVFVDPVPGR